MVRSRSAVYVWIVAMMVGVVAVPVGAAVGGDPVVCGGLEATIVGSDGDDIIAGTDADDVIAGLGGNDQIDGGKGHDVICGNGGDDSLVGGGGRDIVLGGVGHDRIFGGHGKDRLRGGAGDDEITLGKGDDVAIGGPGADCAIFVDSEAGVVVDLRSGTATGEGSGSPPEYPPAGSARNGVRDNTPANG